MNRVCDFFVNDRNPNITLLPIYFSAKELGTQLENWLGAAELTHGPARAIIAPYVFYK